MFTCEDRRSLEIPDSALFRLCSAVYGLYGPFVGGFAAGSGLVRTDVTLHFTSHSTGWFVVGSIAKWYLCDVAVSATFGSTFGLF